MGCVPLGVGNAKGASSPSPSSSLGVSSRWASSRTASSGYRPLSANGRGVRGGTGNPEHEPIRRWNAASDLTSSSSGLVSAKRLSMRGCFN